MADIVDETLLEENEDTMKDKYLTFKLDREEYGLEIKHVTEIIGIQDITEVPELPEYVRGIINLRGKIIPVMDVRLRLRKSARDYNDRTCIIVIDINEISIGLIVDAVAEVLSIPEQDVVPPPQIEKESHNKYIKGIGKISSEVKLLLDCERLLSDEVLESLGEIV